MAGVRAANQLSAAQRRHVPLRRLHDRCHSRADCLHAVPLQLVFTALHQPWARRVYGVALTALFCWIFEASANAVMAYVLAVTILHG